MNPSESPHLVPLSTATSGVRGTIHVEIRAPSDSEIQNQNSKIENPCRDFISSDETLDRYDEIISTSGWRLDTYRKNPVFQNAHQYGDIIFTLGKALITEVRPLRSADLQVGASPAPVRQVLFQRIQFATDINPMARIAYGLYAGGFLHSVSVGFTPIRWQDDPAILPDSCSSAYPACTADGRDGSVPLIQQSSNPAIHPAASL